MKDFIFIFTRVSAILLLTAIVTVVGIKLTSSSNSKLDAQKYHGHSAKTDKWVIYRLTEDGNIETRIGTLYLDSLNVIEHR